MRKISKSLKPIHDETQKKKEDVEIATRAGVEWLTGVRRSIRGERFCFRGMGDYASMRE